MESKQELTIAPGEFISQLFSNTKCSLGDSKQLCKVSKPGEVNDRQGNHPLEGGVYWRTLLSSPQQEAHVVLSAS